MHKGTYLPETCTLKTRLQIRSEHKGTYIPETCTLRTRLQIQSNRAQRNIHTRDMYTEDTFTNSVKQSTKEHYSRHVHWRHVYKFSQTEHKGTYIPETCTLKTRLQIQSNRAQRNIHTRDMYIEDTFTNYVNCNNIVSVAASYSPALYICTEHFL